MSVRPLPGFLKYGDKELGFPRVSPRDALRSKMGTAVAEPPVPPFVQDGVSSLSDVSHR